MLRRRKGAPPRVVPAFAIAFAAIAISQSIAFDAEARPRSRMPSSEWRAGFSSIVVDGKTGDVISSSKADELRHPASLTKVMTLYLLFSEIEAGRLKLNTKIKVSAESAAQPPSKLGLRIGDTLEVEQAIKALITRSANDVAVAVAEVIAGDEETFASLMTQRARRLGMKQTVFKNASGLPHVEQVTTAREMALLALAIQDRFPKLYPYFATRSFSWRGATIGNHNRLLGSVEGVDGIKTGYTNASGFNLISNVKRGERHIVGVVLGGRTGAARDDMMRDLISENIRHAYNGPRKTPRFVERPSPPHPTRVAAAAPVPASSATENAGVMRPNPVRSVQIGKNTEIDNNDEDHARPQLTAGAPMQIAPIPVRPATPVALAPNGKRVTFATPPVANAPSAGAQNSPEVTRTTYAATAPFRPTNTGLGEPPSTLNAQALALNEPPRQAAAFVKDAEQAPAQEAPKQVASLDTEPTASISKGPWKIQIGAFGNEEEAREKLDSARGHASSILARAKAFTEKTYKGATQLFRARFAGLDETSARRACEKLKQNDVECFATRY